jgi:hypothetical protein
MFPIYYILCINDRLNVGVDVSLQVGPSHVSGSSVTLVHTAFTSLGPKEQKMIH